ncbi:hypothetical protein A9Q96_00540 [Rhodobacterales bacterium 52_120_T64]|nr:hypothetical protein A9Q96_00540 [Rhodobacterales bacterium 52_120_T64]
MSKINKPDILWHYTTFEAIIKIIQTGKLLSSNFQTLNDKSEMQTGYNLCIDWMKQHSNENVRALSEDSKFLNALGGGSWPYVISLSDAKDSLSMWRGYGDAVNGNTGVAIGFSKQDLVDLERGQIFEGPTECIYNQETFFRGLDAIAKKPNNAAPMFAIYSDLKKVSRAGRTIIFLKSVNGECLAMFSMGRMINIWKR